MLKFDTNVVIFEEKWLSLLGKLHFKQRINHKDNENSIDWIRQNGSYD